LNQFLANFTAYKAPQSDCAPLCGLSLYIYKHCKYNNCRDFNQSNQFLANFSTYKAPQSDCTITEQQWNRHHMHGSLSITWYIKLLCFNYNKLTNQIGFFFKTHMHPIIFLNTFVTQQLFVLCSLKIDLTNIADNF